MVFYRTAKVIARRFPEHGSGTVLGRCAVVAVLLAAFVGGILLKLQYPHDEIAQLRINIAWQSVVAMVSFVAGLRAGRGAESGWLRVRIRAGLRRIRRTPGAFRDHVAARETGAEVRRPGFGDAKPEEG